MSFFHFYSSEGNNLGSMMQSHMSDPGDGEMKRKVRLFIRGITAYKVLLGVVLLLILGIYFFRLVLRFQGNSNLLTSYTAIKNVLFAILFISFLGYFLLKTALRIKTNRWLYQDCRPDKLLNYLYYVATLKNHHARSMIYVGTAARMMVFLGRFDEAARLLVDTGPLLSRDSDRFDYCMAAAALALDRSDAQNATMHIQCAESLVSVKNRRKNAERLLSRQQRLEVLIAELAGSPAELQFAYDYYNAIVSSRGANTFEIVGASYHLARLASDKQEAHEAYEYAAKFGGTTWYAAESKKILGIENQSPSAP